MSLLFVFTLLCVAAGQAKQVEIRVFDEAGRPSAARLRLRDAAGKLLPVRVISPLPAVVTHPRFADLGVVMDGSVVIELPESHPRILIDRGLEYRPVEIDSGRSRPMEIVRLKRWIHMAKRGWWSGDLHVHREPADMPLLIRAADIHIAPVLTRWNDSPAKTPWIEPLQATVDRDRVFTIDNAEDERPWGAALFFALRAPPQLHPYRSHWPPPIGFWPTGAQSYLELEKPIWWGAPAVALLARPASIGVVNNHFMEEGMMDNEAWGRPRDRTAFPGFQGFAEYVCMLYAKYLSAGLRIPASAGSANGVLKNPLGYSRVYVHLDGPFSPEAWWKAQRAGRNFVTNGPLLWMTAGGQLPGAILPESARTVTVKLEARSRDTIDRLDLLVDGEVVQTVRPGKDPLHVTARANVSVKPGGWIAARCFAKTERTVRLAHTSPVYIGPTPHRSPAAAQWMRDWIAAWRGEIRKVPAEKLTSAQKAGFEELCDRAEAALR